MTTPVDLSAFSLAELQDIQARLPKELQKRRSKDVAEARRLIAQIAEGVGVPLEALLSVPISGEKGTRPPLFADPKDPARTWSGHGRKPFWIRGLEDEGYTLDQLRIHQKERPE